MDGWPGILLLSVSGGFGTPGFVVWYDGRVGSCCCLSGGEE